MNDTYTNPYIIKKANGFTLKVSKPFKNTGIRVTSSKDDINRIAQALIYETHCSENDIAVFEAIDNDKTVCYIVMDISKLERSLIDINVESTDVIRVCDKRTKDEEDLITEANRYKMMNKLASEYLLLPEDKKTEVDMTYNNLTDSDKEVIDYDPNSEWFGRQILARHNILCKCAYEELTGHKKRISPRVIVPEEYNDDFTPTQKRYCIAVDSSDPIFRDFELIDVKDLASWRKKLNLPYIQNKLYIATNLSADDVRMLELTKARISYVFYIIRTMDWIRSSTYRKDCFDAAQIHNGYTRCAYCGLKFKKYKMEADHIIPVYAVTGKRGAAYKVYMESHGFSKGVNDTKNLAPACRTCNRMKGKKTGLWTAWGFLGKTEWFHPLMKVIFYSVIFIFIVRFIADINSYNMFSGASKWRFIKRELISGPDYLYIRIVAGALIARIMFIIERKLRNM